MRTELQEKVIAIAYDRLNDREWFNGICTDKLPQDHEILRRGEDEVVKDLILDTQYWDDPSFL